MRPLRVYLYGVEGLGKTTWAAGAPAPIFLGAEEGTSHLDVCRFPKPDNWEDVQDALTTLRDSEHPYKTVVVDTIDWLEPLCAASLCAAHGKSRLDDFGYGKGYVMLEAAFREILDGNRSGDACFTDLWKKGMHVVFLGHAKKKTDRDPSLTQDYDRWVPKAHEKVTSVVKEWCDTVLFGQYEVLFRKDEKDRKRAFDSGTRIVKTTWTVGADAKNRQDLPPIMPLDFREFYRVAARDEPEVNKADVIEAIKSEILKLPETSREAANAALTERSGDVRALLRLLDFTKARVVQGGKKEE